MTIDLRPSTRRMIEESPATKEACAFIEWLHTARYTDHSIDCHIRRLLFVMPRLSCGSTPPVLRDVDLVAVFRRERHPRSRFLVFASTRRVYTRYLRAQGRLVAEPDHRLRISSASMTSTSPRSAACLSRPALTTRSLCVNCWHIPSARGDPWRSSRATTSSFSFSSAAGRFPATLCNTKLLNCGPSCAMRMTWV